MKKQYAIGLPMILKHINACMTARHRYRFYLDTPEQAWRECRSPDFLEWVWYEAYRFDDNKRNKINEFIEDNIGEIRRNSRLLRLNDRQRIAWCDVELCRMIRERFPFPKKRCEEIIAYIRHNQSRRRTK